MPDTPVPEAPTADRVFLHDPAFTGDIKSTIAGNDTRRLVPRHAEMTGVDTRTGTVAQRVTVIYDPGR